MRTETVARLVGYLEYGRSLAMFDSLVRSSSEDELAVIEQVIADRDEFAIYTNLSRRLEKQPSSLSEPTVADANFRQLGLGWMMALARVEVGALAAGFTEVENPFAVFPPTSYELAQFRELMLDGLRTHYLALQNDPVVQFYWANKSLPPLPARTRPFSSGEDLREQQAIAYARRIGLVREFMQAVQGLGNGSLNPPQQTQLSQWSSQVEQLESVMLLKVLRLADTVAATESMHTKTVLAEGNGRWATCPRMLRNLNGHIASITTKQAAPARSTQTTRSVNQY